MDAGHIRVSSVTRGLTCVIEVSGELTQATERKFAAQVAEAQVALRGPVLFDVSGVNFVDCRTGPSRPARHHPVRRRTPVRAHRRARRPW